MLVEAEPYGLWVIQSPVDISAKIPVSNEGLDVVFTKDLETYRKRKTRILNGAHTSFCLVSFLCGINTVYESMQDETIKEFLNQLLYKEILPTIDMPYEDLES